MKAFFAILTVACLGASLRGTVSSAASNFNPEKTVLYVATTGSDDNPGTLQQPFASLEKAKKAVRENTAPGPVRVLLREGTYYLKQPFELGPGDSATADAPVTYAAYPGERVTLSGGRRLDCHWRAYENGIMMCELPEAKGGKLVFTQLFVNGKRQVRARYPNYDNSRPAGAATFIRPTSSRRTWWILGPAPTTT